MRRVLRLAARPHGARTSSPSRSDRLRRAGRSSSASRHPRRRPPKRSAAARSSCRGPCVMCHTILGHHGGRHDRARPDACREPALDRRRAPAEHARPPRRLDRRPADARSPATTCRRCRCRPRISGRCSAISTRSNDAAMSETAAVPADRRAAEERAALDRTWAGRAGLYRLALRRRPQDDRHPLSRYRVRLLPARRPARGGDAPATGAAGKRRARPRPLQPGCSRRTAR